MSEVPTPQRVLAVVAHPDDIEFMAGGAVARWARAGAELHYCLLTDGSAGSRDPSLTQAQLAALRQDEQRAAGGLVGVASYTFVGEPDGRLADSIGLRLAIARVIRAVRPDTVLTTDPQFYYSATYLNHPDHRAAGALTMAAIMPLANTRLAAPELLAEGLEPHDVSYVYMAAPARATHWVGLAPEDMEMKLAMLAAHASQVGAWPYQAMVRSFGQRAAEEARAAGQAHELAEGFVLVNLRRDPPPQEG